MTAEGFKDFQPVTETRSSEVVPAPHTLHEGASSLTEIDSGYSTDLVPASGHDLAVPDRSPAVTDDTTGGWGPVIEGRIIDRKDEPAELAIPEEVPAETPPLTEVVDVPDLFSGEHYRAVEAPAADVLLPHDYFKRVADEEEYRPLTAFEMFVGGVCTVVEAFQSDGDGSERAPGPSQVTMETAPATESLSGTAPAELTGRTSEVVQAEVGEPAESLQVTDGNGSLALPSAAEGRRTLSITAGDSSATRLSDIFGSETVAEKLRLGRDV